MKEIDESGNVFEVVGKIRRRRLPVVVWESNPIEARAGEPVTIRAQLVDFDGEPRIDSHGAAVLDPGFGELVRAPITQGVLSAEAVFPSRGRYVLRLTGAPVEPAEVEIRCS